MISFDLIFVRLKDFMNAVLANSMLANSLPVKRFLDEENYSENFKELALAHVSMFFRSESNWQVLEVLNDIGSPGLLISFFLNQLIWVCVERVEV